MRHTHGSPQRVAARQALRAQRRALREKSARDVQAAAEKQKRDAQEAREREASDVRRIQAFQEAEAARVWRQRARSEQLIRQWRADERRRLEAERQLLIDRAEALRLGISDYEYHALKKARARLLALIQAVSVKRERERLRAPRSGQRLSFFEAALLLSCLPLSRAE